MGESVQVIEMLYRLLTLLIFVRVIITWIPGLRPDHPAVRAVHQITSPVLDPIRRLMPPIGGLDLSPWVAVLLLSLVRTFLVDALLTL